MAITVGICVKKRRAPFWTGLESQTESFLSLRHLRKLILPRFLWLLILKRDEKLSRAKRCNDEGVKEGVKTAGIACVASAIPTLISVRVIPWAKENLNYTAQTLIISTASIASYFIVAEKTILECSRQNTIKQYKDLPTE